MALKWLNNIIRAQVAGPKFSALSTQFGELASSCEDPVIVIWQRAKAFDSVNLTQPALARFDSWVETVKWQQESIIQKEKKNLRYIHQQAVRGLLVEAIMKIGGYVSAANESVPTQMARLFRSVRQRIDPTIELDTQASREGIDVWRKERASIEQPTILLFLRAYDFTEGTQFAPHAVASLVALAMAAAETCGHSSAVTNVVTRYQEQLNPFLSRQ